MTKLTISRRLGPLIGSSLPGPALLEQMDVAASSLKTQAQAQAQRLVGTAAQFQLAAV